ncbi:MAG TPA: BON domain-containing protein [Thermomicrobiaceae bacterium]|nr:BON domain-containing protein [Thermomicrobiaceae bacterium]
MSSRWNTNNPQRGPGGNQPNQLGGVSGPGFGQGYPFYGGGFGPSYWTSGQGGYAFGGFYGSGGLSHGRYGQGWARLGANQGQGFGSSYQEGVYGGGSGLGYGGFGPYGHPYQGQNFGLGYGYGSYGARPTPIPGPHAGKGPRNYQRTDAELQDAICHRLSQDGFDTSRIDVAVHHGQVTLSGSVASRPWKRRAEDVAESVGGVVDVHNRLRITATP